MTALDSELAAYLDGLYGCPVEQAGTVMFDQTGDETRAYLLGFFDRERRAEELEADLALHLGPDIAHQVTGRILNREPVRWPDADQLDREDPGTE